MIVAISVGIGMIPLIAPNFKQWMPHGVHPLIESGILLSSIAAVALKLFYNGAREDTAATIAAARRPSLLLAGEATGTEIAIAPGMLLAVDDVHELGEAAGGGPEADLRGAI